MSTLSNTKVLLTSLKAHIKCLFTSPDGAVVMSSANGLVGTGFILGSGFLKTQWVGVWPLHPLLSH